MEERKKGRKKEEEERMKERNEEIKKRKKEGKKRIFRNVPNGRELRGRGKYNKSE